MKIYEWEFKIVNAISSFHGKNHFLDFVMAGFSDEIFGVIILISILACLFFKIEKRKFYFLSFQCLLALLIADISSRFLFKNIFHRLRPRFVGLTCDHLSCYGFVSSHASDFFGVLTIFIFIDKRNILWGLPIGLLVCISRLYLYDHFPLDVVGGAFLGLFIGYSVNYFSKFKTLKYFNLSTAVLYFLAISPIVFAHTNHPHKAVAKDIVTTASEKINQNSVIQVLRKIINQNRLYDPNKVPALSWR